MNHVDRSTVSCIRGYDTYEPHPRDTDLFRFQSTAPALLNLEVNWSLEGRIIAFELEILSLLKFSNKKDGWKYGMLG